MNTEALKQIQAPLKAKPEDPEPQSITYVPAETLGEVSLLLG